MTSKTRHRRATASQRLPAPPTRGQIAIAAHAQSAAALNQFLIDSGIALRSWRCSRSGSAGSSLVARFDRCARSLTPRARSRPATRTGASPLQGPDDELAQLATTFDDLLARVEAAFDAQRQFVANASHELRTISKARRSQAAGR
jgi:signal transduction histidine kinase